MPGTVASPGLDGQDFVSSRFTHSTCLAAQAEHMLRMQTGPYWIGCLSSERFAL